MSNIEGVAGSFAPQKPLEGAGAKRARRDQLMYDRTRIKSPVRLWDAWHRVQLEAEVRDWDLRWSFAECADALGVARPLDPEVPGYSEAPAREMSIKTKLREHLHHNH